MKPLSIKYRLPFPFSRYMLTIKREYPESWSELSELQFITFEDLHQGDISDIVFIEMFYRIPKWIVKRASDFEKYTLLNELEFMADALTFHYFLMQRGYQSKISFENLKSPLSIMVDNELELQQKKQQKSHTSKRQNEA